MDAAVSESLEADREPDTTMVSMAVVVFLALCVCVYAWDSKGVQLSR